MAQETGASEIQQVEIVNDLLNTKDTDRTAETVISTPGGQVNVIHEVTLGDIVITTILLFILIFQLLDRVIRRS